MVEPSREKGGEEGALEPFFHSLISFCFFDFVLILFILLIFFFHFSFFFFKQIVFVTKKLKNCFF